MSISKIFIPNSLCVFSQIKDRKHIEQNFHSVARVIPRGAGILLPAHPASFAHKFLFEQVPASPGMQ